MKFSTLLNLAVLSRAASAASKSTPALDVQIASVGNSEVKATIKNTGSKPIRLLKEGTILDSAPVQKLHIQSSTGPLKFHGIKKTIKTTDLSPSAFTTLASGASLSVTVDLASVHDLSEGGAYHVLSAGTIGYADDAANDLTGYIPLTSNTLQVKVDGSVAAKVPKAVQLPKSELQSQVSDCSGSQGSSTQNALQQCASLASASADHALNGDANKFAEYFGTTDYGARQTVAARYSAVANECGGSPYSGVTTTHCVDYQNYCSSNTLAYTIPTQSYIVNCPLYFQVLSALTSSCHGQDQATTTIHEMTHADAVYSPGTDDLGYGYNAVMQLSANDRINNADTYALYTNALVAGC